MKALEMIVVRENEPLMGVENFLNLLSMQRKLKSYEFQVVLMQLARDKGDDADMRTLLNRYPFDVSVIECTNYTNKTQAYNDRIRDSKSPWLMFIDYADLFCDLYSISMITNLLPTDEYDVIWNTYYSEYMDNSNNMLVNIAKDADAEIHGKLFRRQFLVENDLFFNEDQKYNIGRIFMTTVISVCGYERFAKCGMQFTPFVHVYHPVKEYLSQFDIIHNRHKMNMTIVEDIGKHGKGFNYREAVMRTICDAYFYLNAEGAMPGITQLDKEIYDFYVDHKKIVDEYKKNDLEVLLDTERQDMFALIQLSYVQYGHQMYFDVDNLPFNIWLDRFKRAEHNIVKLPVAKTETSDDKVAVFCGTRNVYEEMETAAKSLMYHTPMDRIYFLIEDNTFPHVLPDYIKVINVSGQEFFDKKGVNYNNVWTYMCMMRAAFAKVLPDEHKVLSLDVDIIVNEDISELWDIDLSEYYYAGVPEPDRTHKLSAPYMNFGVILMNLDKIREDRVDDLIIDSLNKSRWGCPEQDCFNHFCKDHLYPLDPMYNVTRQSHITGESDREKVAHYAGIKYYKHFKPFRMYSKMDWEDITKGDKADE